MQFLNLQIYLIHKSKKKKTKTKCRFLIDHIPLLYKEENIKAKNNYYTIAPNTMPIVKVSLDRNSD